MRSLTGPKAPEKAADPIIVHPDVRRMLLTQKAYAEAGRAFTYWAALNIDKELSHADEAVRSDSADFVALLTPVIKAFLTDNAFEGTNMGMQIYGGHGFIAEWGMEQYVRDARINMIYEGTNSIQALDLLGRKILGDMGAKLKKFGQLVHGLRRRRRREAGDAGVHQPARGHRRQGAEADDGNRHEGDAEPRRSRRRCRAVSAHGRPSGVLVLLGAHGARRARQGSRRRPVLQGQARDRALLFREAAARNGIDDPRRHARARRR